MLHEFRAAILRQDNQHVDLKDVVDWMSEDFDPGVVLSEPLTWLRNNPHVRQRVRNIAWNCDWAVWHAGLAKVATWGSVRDFNLWELQCVIACPCYDGKRRTSSMRVTTCARTTCHLATKVHERR